MIAYERGWGKVIQEALKEAADKLGIKLLKSDNIALGGIIPLPDGRKGVIIEEVELCSSQEKWWPQKN